MNIVVIGSGLMGSAIGMSWARAGHRVTFAYSRDASKLEDLARQAENEARAATTPDALRASVAEADVVLISALWNRLDDALSQAGSLAGKTVISCMVPMTDDDSALAVGFNTSGLEILAEKTHANVVGTFNTVWSDVIRRRIDDKSDPVPNLFYIGDDVGAKQTAATLIRDAGFDPVDAGGVQAARLLEPFGLLMGQLGYQYNPQVIYQFLGR